MNIRRALAGATAGTMLALLPAAAAVAADGGSASGSASASVAEETAAPASASASVAEETAAPSSSGSASEAEAETEESEEGAVPEGAPDTGVGGGEEGTNSALLASGLGVLVAGAALGAVALRRSRQV